MDNTTKFDDAISNIEDNHEGAPDDYKPEEVGPKDLGDK